MITFIVTNSDFIYNKANASSSNGEAISKGGAIYNYNTINNGGRNGVALSFGFKWSFGKDNL